MTQGPSTIKSKKIIVIGSPGAGKTTYAKRLASETGLPLFHLDDMFWAPGWVEKGTASFRGSLFNAIGQDEWILDGNYMSTMEERLSAADAVFFIDVPYWLCTYRIIKRWLCREGQQAEGCPQRVDLAFIKYVAWDFPRRDRARLNAMLAAFARRGTVHII
jgi:adenylate kinase family enzyme|tara:strand:- start:274 stop:756 length:483 start_codon:yes stop_codon:yes gene_type:complete